MARLSIEQIRAPDLSVASQATARAGESFQRGMSSASELLSNYQAGIEASGDAELTNLLAGASNEEEWNAILNSTDFSQMNLSAGMRDNIINRRDNVLAYGQARANTGLTVANTGNVNASAANTRNNTRINSNAEVRNQGNYDWADGVRREDVALGNLAVAAEQENRTNGFIPASGLQNENVSGLNFGPRADGSGLQTPGTPTQISYRDGIASIESDGSGGYDAIGATHETLGRALGRYQIMEANLPQWSQAALGREVTAEEFMADSSIQDAIFDHRFGGYVEQYGEENAARAWFGGEGGINNPNGTDVHGRLNIGDYGSTFLSNIGGNRQPVTQNPNGQGGAATVALRDALQNSQFTSSANQRSFTGQAYGDAIIGQNAINAADQADAAEFRAQQQLDLLDSPDVLTSTEAIVASSQLPEGATAAETLNNRLIVAAGVSEGGPLANLLDVGTSSDPEATAIAQTIIEERAAEVQRSPILRAAAGAISFSNDPYGSLTSALEGMGISTIPSEIEGAINKMARDMGITPGEAAYAFSRAAEIDIPLLPDWTIGGDNLSQNRANDLAEQWFTGEGAREARQTLRDNESLDRDVVTLQSSVQTALRRVQKSANDNDGTPNASYVRAYETAAAALDAAVEESVGYSPSPGAQSFIPINPAAMMPYVGSGPGDGSDIQAYLDSLNN